MLKLLLSAAVLVGLPLAHGDGGDDATHDGLESTAPRLAVFEYGERAQLRDHLIANGRMYDDLGGYILGENDPQLARDNKVRAEILPPLRSDVQLAVVVHHNHGDHGVRNPAETAGREVWHAPNGSVSLRAIPQAVMDQVSTHSFSCHGSFRTLERDRPLKLALFNPGPHVSGGMPDMITPKPQIQGWVGQVSQSNIQSGVNSLVAFGTRRHNEPGEVNAQNWIRNQFNSFSLNTTLFNYDGGADVVIGELPGVSDPSRIVVIGAHYDSVNWQGSATSPAPGADDDASGTSAVIEIARILSQQQFDYTIRFCGWSGEEFGLLGSEAYAAMLDNINADIVGMVQLDMVAYRANGDTRSVDFVTNDTTPSLNAFAQDVYRAYVPTLPVKSGSLSGGTSDHRSFFRHGFPATFPFEDVGQYSPFIHTASDTVGTSANDFVLARLITQGALATVAELARPLSISLTHTPLQDTQNEIGPYTATVVATPQTQNTVTGVDLFYRVNGGAYQTVAMSPTGTPDEWSGDIPGQSSPSTVEYYMVATDSGQNQAWLPEAFSPGENTYRFIVGTVTQIYFQNFDGPNDAGWTHGQIATQDDWQRNVPNGSAGSSSGVSWSDPNSASSGARVWGNDLGPSGWNGAYQANVNNWLESPSIDCSNRTGVTLRFRRWLTVEESQFDQAIIRVNGTEVWRNPVSGHILDSSWSTQEVDISSIADNNPNVRVRFVLQSDGGLELGGWNIDDFEVLSVGGSSKDVVVLTGPTTTTVGATINVSISNGSANSPYWYYWSRKQNGSIINGHPFDIGPTVKTLTTGTTNGAGAASWTSGPVPGKAAGLTVYIEARVDDLGAGKTLDSNVLTLTVQ